MPPINFLAKEYENRQNLEEIIKAEAGMDMDKNRISGHSISGTRAEVKKLLLDDTGNVFGVRVIITDYPSKDILKKK